MDVIDTAKTTGRFMKGVGVGLFKGGKDFVADMAQSVQDGVDTVGTVYDLATNPGARQELFDSIAQSLHEAEDWGTRQATEAYRDPAGKLRQIRQELIDTKQMVGEAFDQSYRRFKEAEAKAEAEGRLADFYGELAGRGGFELIPWGKLKYVAKASHVKLLEKAKVVGKKPIKKAVQKKVKETKKLGKHDPKTHTLPCQAKNACEEVHVQPGKKGGWNKELNRPKPNTLYRVGPCRPDVKAPGCYSYQTDGAGRVTKVSGKIKLALPDDVKGEERQKALEKTRNSYQQSKAGKKGKPGDEGGHLIGTVFGGPGEAVNLVPMGFDLNRKDFREMERELMKKAPVGVSMEVIYDKDNPARPSKIVVRVEGEKKARVFFNE